MVSELSRMLSSIDTCPLTRKQKLLLYKPGVCPLFSWLLTIEQFPISWVQKHVDSLATSFLKKRAGLARPANTALLHLPTKIGGLNLPQLWMLHKKLQVPQQAQLLAIQVSDTWQKRTFKRILLYLDQSFEHQNG